MSYIAETTTSNKVRGLTLEIHTLRDSELDARRERFFEGIERLIFVKGHSEARKSMILRRYSSMLAAQGDRWSAAAAHQLAETYDATLRQFR